MSKNLVGDDAEQVIFGRGSCVCTRSENHQFKIQFGYFQYLHSFKIPSCTDLGADQATSGSLKHRDTCAWCTGGTWRHLHQLVHHHHHHHHHQLVQPGDQRSGRVGAAGVDRGSRRAEGTDFYCLIFYAGQNMSMTPNFFYVIFVFGVICNFPFKGLFKYHFFGTFYNIKR